MKKTKYTTGLIIAILGFSFPVILSQAVNATNLTTAQTQAETQAKTQAKTNRIQNLKTRADTEINRRLAALNLLTTKVNLLKKLSADQKTSFNTDIQNNITDLTALKVKIAADTDPITLQTDVKSIIGDYRIFALYIPKIHLLAGADAVTDMTTNLSILAIKLQTKITTDQQAGKDTTTAQAALIDMQAKITAALTQAQNVTATVIPLAPTGYPGNSSSLKSSQVILKAARSDLQTARQDAQQIIKALKSLK